MNPQKTLVKEGACIFYGFYENSFFQYIYFLPYYKERFMISKQMTVCNVYCILNVVK